MSKKDIFVNFIFDDCNISWVFVRLAIKSQLINKVDDEIIMQMDMGDHMEMGSNMRYAESQPCNTARYIFFFSN